MRTFAAEDAPREERSERRRRWQTGDESGVASSAIVLAFSSILLRRSILALHLHVNEELRLTRSILLPRCCLA
jgi:hypothetical protein